MRMGMIVGIGTLMVLAAAGLSLASTDEMIKAKVPFAFTVGDRELPAGDYEVFAAETTNPGGWIVRATNGEHEAIALTEDVDSTKPATATELVFDVVGQKHFLRKMYFEGEDTGLQIAASNAERALEAKGNTRTEHRLACERAPHHKAASTAKS